MQSYDKRMTRATEFFIWDLEELKPVYLGGSPLYLPPTELESELEHT